MPARKFEAPKWLKSELIIHLINKSKNDPARFDFLQDGRRWRDWYRGQTFLAPIKGHDDMTVPEQDATARRNIIGETLDASSSIFLKNAPIIRRIPLQARWGELADDLDAMWFWQWRECFGKTVARSLLEDAAITGIGSAKLYWDHHKGRRRAKGGIIVKSIPNGSIYMDPMAAADFRGWDASFVVEHMKRFPEEIIARYGEPAAKALGWHSGKAPNMRPTNPTAWQNLGMTNDQATADITGRNSIRASWPPAGPSMSEGNESDKVDFYEAWLFPDLLYGSELSGGDQVPEHYRFGLVASMVNDKIIRVRPNPFAQRIRLETTNDRGQESNVARWVGHGSHPYVFLHWRRIADKEGNRHFYNVMSMIEWMVSLQFNVNALRRNMARLLRTLANPMLAYNEDALKTPVHQIVGAPGQMIAVRGRYRIAEAIQPIGPTQMPPQVENMIAADIEGMRDASGVQRGVTGLFPAPAGGTSHTSGEVFGPLQEAAFGPLWKYVEHVGDAFEDMATKMEGLMQQYFTADHYIASSRRGIQTEVEWTDEHRIAQFRRIVVAGATTPIYDLQREQREGFVKQEAVQAILSGDPRIIRATILFLNHMNFPWTADYVQLLEEELQRLNMMMGTQKNLGLQTLLSGQAQQLALPAQAGQGETEDLSALAESMNVSPEQLMAAAIGR
jgi:hypothetical protein